MTVRSVAPRTFALGLCVAALWAAVSGCQGLSLTSARAPKIAQASAANPVIEIICLWKSSEGTGLDGHPTRGFTGQIMFFTARRPEAVVVDGDVRISIFDDQGDEAEQGRPVGQLAFTSAEWNTFCHETDFGATYVLFVPYPRRGGQEANCSLQVRLDPREGQAISSKPASLALPGRKVRTGILVNTISPSAHSSATPPSELPSPAAPPAQVALTGSPSASPALRASLARLHEIARQMEETSGHPEDADAPDALPSAADRYRLSNRREVEDQP